MSWRNESPVPGLMIPVTISRHAIGQWLCGKWGVDNVPILPINGLDQGFLVINVQCYIMATFRRFEAFPAGFWLLTYIGKTEVDLPERFWTPYVLPECGLFVSKALADLCVQWFANVNRTHISQVSSYESRDLIWASTARLPVLSNQRFNQILMAMSPNSEPFRGESEPTESDDPSSHMMILIRPCPCDKCWMVTYYGFIGDFQKEVERFDPDMDYGPEPCTAIMCPCPHHAPMSTGAVAVVPRRITSFQTDEESVEEDV